MKTWSLWLAPSFRPISYLIFRQTEALILSTQQRATKPLQTRTQRKTRNKAAEVIWAIFKLKKKKKRPRTTSTISTEMVLSAYCWCCTRQISMDISQRCSSAVLILLCLSATRAQRLGTEESPPEIILPAAPELGRRRVGILYFTFNPDPPKDPGRSSSRLLCAVWRSRHTAQGVYTGLAYTARRLYPGPRALNTYRPPRPSEVWLNRPLQRPSLTSAARPDGLGLPTSLAVQSRTCQQAWATHHAENVTDEDIQVD